MTDNGGRHYWTRSWEISTESSASIRWTAVVHGLTWFRMSLRVCCFVLSCVLYSHL